MFCVNVIIFIFVRVIYLNKRNMEVKGRIVQVLPLQSGIGQVSGKEWRKQEYVLEMQDQYARKICFQVNGNRIEQYPAAVGDEVVVSFDLESRESHGRWYTDVRAWKIEKVSGGNTAVPPQTGSVPPPTADLEPESNSSEDLPF